MWNGRATFGQSIFVLYLNITKNKRKKKQNKTEQQ